MQCFPLLTEAQHRRKVKGKQHLNSGHNNTGKMWLHCEEMKEIYKVIAKTGKSQLFKQRDRSQQQIIVGYNSAFRKNLVSN